MTRTHVALLRGINLGAANKVPMAQLRAMGERLGWGDIATHVNSGNLVFTAPGDAADLERALAAEVEAYVGKPIQTLVVSTEDWIDAVEQCPYVPREDKFVHIQAHRAPLHHDVVTALAQCAAAADDGTEISADGRWLYIHTPDGLSKSVAFTKFPRLVPKADPGTARNLNSSKAIAALLRG